ncbi:flagellar brake protein [Pseudokineococcus sp. 1T1Z-3]|uniref:flagellar brake protein n=1 Tax=Pseudokineococcus sp. 1T1Z-3 TaxID=3132745 RepID=UPI0030B3B018
MGSARGATTARLLPADDVPPVGALLDVAPHRASAALTARLLDVGPDRLVLAPPTDVLGTPAALAEGEQVDLVWGEHGEVLGVSAVVARRADTEWTATITSTLQKVQRRDAVRVRVDLRATIARARLTSGPVPVQGGSAAVPAREMAEPAEGLHASAPPPLLVPVDDLSETGARCVVDPVVLRLDQGERVLLDLPVDGLTGPVTATVVHRRFRPGARGVLVGLRFTDLPTGDADLLRRYVFTRLRELRRRGAL